MTIIWRLRVLIFYTLVSIATFITFIICYIPMTFFNINYDIRYKIGFVYSHVFIWLAKVTCGLNYQVSGLDKLPTTPSIVLSNHQSFWDNIFMQIIIPEHSWVLKRELFNIPLFGWGLRMVKPIAVDRNANISVKQILTEGQKKILEGLWLIIFPESTRLKPEETKKFKPSAVKLASITKVPIVMIAHNAGVYWPKGFWIKQPGIIKVTIIDVISVEEIEQTDVRILTEKIEHVINSEKQRLFEETMV